MSLPVGVSFQASDGQVSLPLARGKVYIIAGPNGTGKSALLVELYRALGSETATYLPGHRQIHFNSDWDATSRGLEQIYQQLFTNHGHFNRYKNSWAEDQFKSEMRMLQNKAAEYDRSFRSRIQARKTFQEPQDSFLDSPLDRVNEIFSQARLPVRFIPTAKGLSAQRGVGPPYSIERLSDGERAALFIAAAFVNRNSDTVLLIDEPEKHLDQSIASLFIEACIRMRDDIAVFLSTHDPRLIERLNDKDLLHIRDSEIVSENPERRRYSVSPVSDSEEGLDLVKRDLMGIRSRVLFVEGKATSLDVPVYTHVYDDVRIVPKGGFQDVCNSTRGIARLVDGHWLEPRGLIDGDGREDAEITKLKRDGIFALPCPTVENLFFIDAAISCFIEADMHHHGGLPEGERMAKYAVEVEAAARIARDDIIARRTSWRVARALEDQKLSPKDIRDGPRSDLVIDVSALYNEIARQVDEVVASGDTKRVMLGLPIKNTILPDRGAKALGAMSFDEYVKVILRRVELGEPAGLHLVDSLRLFLPKLFENEGARIT